jgi:hypothetical protein
MDLRKAIQKPKYITLSELIFSPRPTGLVAEVSTEGIVDNVTQRFRNLFEKREKEVHEEIINGEQVLTKVDNIRAMLENKNDLRNDPSQVRLGIYAKWVSIHGVILDDADAVLKELLRLKDLVDLYNTAYIPALNNLFNYIADNVLKQALNNPVEAIDTYEQSPDFFPKQFNRVLKRRRKGVVGGNVTDVKGSDNYIGDWYIGSISDSSNLAKCTLDISLHYDLTVKKIKEAHLQPYSKEEIESILAVVSEIAKSTISVSQYSKSDDSFKKVYHDIAELEKKYTRWDSQGKRTIEEKAVHDCVMIAHTAFWEVEEFIADTAVFNHICRVVLKICEHSIHRMV